MPGTQVKQHRQLQRGRGALSNPVNRFHDRVTEVVADGWDSQAEQPALRTQLFVDRSRSVMVYNRSPDVPFDRAINPYRGCEHGCVYCFARPTHAYLDCSPGLDFESRLFYKPEAAAILARELSRSSYSCRPVALGSNTDAYQPVERKLRLTRSLLEVLQAHRHPVGIITKSSLIERDIDLLNDMAEQGLVHVMVSVTTLDNGLSRMLEPRASAARRRVEIVRRLSQAGIPVGVLVAPLIPFLNDNELENILMSVREAGALTAGYIMIRLPHEVKTLFQDWLRQHVPDKAAHIMQRIRDMHDGREYDAAYGHRMVGGGPYADLIRRRFEAAVRRCEFPGMPDFECGRFRCPQQEQPQLPLF